MDLDINLVITNQHKSSDPVQVFNLVEAIDFENFNYHN